MHGIDLEVVLDQDNMPIDSGVYFLFYKQTNVVKIGMSETLRKRLNQHRRASSDTLQVLGVAHPDKDYRDLMSLKEYLHDLFRVAHIEGEWFKATPEIFNVAKDYGVHAWCCFCELELINLLYDEHGACDDCTEEFLVGSAGKVANNMACILTGPQSVYSDSKQPEIRYL
jgi:hypothetical protein